MYIEKIKLSLCLIKHHAMKMYGRVKIKLHALLTTALDGREWSASRLVPLPPGKGPHEPPGEEASGPTAGQKAVVNWTRTCIYRKMFLVQRIWSENQRKHAITKQKLINQEKKNN
jgi:hypothetical protein